MKIIMGGDFGGYDLKEAVKADLLSKGYEIFDVSPGAPLLYQDVAKAVAKGVQSGEYDRGIMMCGTGMGISIIANKYRGVYAGLCESVYTAWRSKAVNNTNVLCMGGFIVGHVLGVEMANAWLNAQHMEGLSPEMKEKCAKESLAFAEVESEIYR
ncbi:MAG: RpiB/LacA/LacB family sugar-phosphate isomerase [Christensenella sp.]|uniref:RpiB/LacA/LacB family sugar-phosphate isomerase n=1 Tax=Christensenella sp. TaxID=1935934 RepID=UPI002B212199|nr:RpiB/LacA/LacB family sugar-phosphate isomerase [Christensenella sp.]MEA5004475.1 RpiB/LacA/LacB family sugar-phosphate isomerase [Christensenella sp.]